MELLTFTKTDMTTLTTCNECPDYSSYRGSVGRYNRPPCTHGDLIDNLLKESVHR